MLALIVAPFIIGYGIMYGMNVDNKLNKSRQVVLIMILSILMALAVWLAFISADLFGAPRWNALWPLALYALTVYPTRFIAWSRKKTLSVQGKTT